MFFFGPLPKTTDAVLSNHVVTALTISPQFFSVGVKLLEYLEQNLKNEPA